MSGHEAEISLYITLRHLLQLPRECDMNVLSLYDF